MVLVAYYQSKILVYQREGERD